MNNTSLKETRSTAILAVGLAGILPARVSQLRVIRQARCPSAPQAGSPCYAVLGGRGRPGSIDIEDKWRQPALRLLLLIRGLLFYVYDYFSSSVALFQILDSLWEFA